MDDDDDLLHALERSQAVLTELVSTIRGAPPPDAGWSHHDLVPLVSEMRNLLNGTAFDARMERERLAYHLMVAEFHRTGELPSD